MLLHMASCSLCHHTASVLEPLLQEVSCHKCTVAGQRVAGCCPTAAVPAACRMVRSDMLYMPPRLHTALRTFHFCCIIPLVAFGPFCGVVAAGLMYGAYDCCVGSWQAGVRCRVATSWVSLLVACLQLLASSHRGWKVFPGLAEAWAMCFALSLC